MKKIIVIIALIIGKNIIYAQDFAKYEPASLKNAHSEDGLNLKHIAPAKMIIYGTGDHKESFYFNTDGKLKAVSSKEFSYQVAEKTIQKNINGAKGEKTAPTPEFITTIKSKLDKAFSLLKK